MMETTMKIASPKNRAANIVARLSPTLRSPVEETFGCVFVSLPSSRTIRAEKSRT